MSRRTGGQGTGDRSHREEEDPTDHAVGPEHWGTLQPGPHNGCPRRLRLSWSLMEPYMEPLEKCTWSLVVPLEECSWTLMELYMEFPGECSWSLLGLYVESLGECSWILTELYMEALGEGSWSLMELHVESLGERSWSLTV